MPDSVSKVASRIEQRLENCQQVTIRTVDEVGDEVYVAFDVHDGPQSSFTVKKEQPSQFTSGGYKSTSTTLMLPEISENADELQVESAVQEFDDRARQEAGIPPVVSTGFGIQSVPNTDGRAPRLSRSNVDLDAYLDYIEYYAENFDVDDQY